MKARCLVQLISNGNFVRTPDRREHRGAFESKKSSQEGIREGERNCGEEGVKHKLLIS